MKTLTGPRIDAEPVTLAMHALTEVEQDDWSMEFDAEHVHLDKMYLVNFDWSNKADDHHVHPSFDGYKLREMNIMGEKSEQVESDLRYKGLETRRKKKELDQALKEKMISKETRQALILKSSGCYVAFGNDSKGGRISGKGTIKTSCIDFEKVSYVEELKFNLLSVSQICDKKHNVLFTDKECLILSPKFKFVDEDLSTKDEAVLWHRRLGHVNFKNINKLVKGNLVRGLPSKTFKLDHSCLACRKGKQHRASCKKIEERTVREPLELLHMDLFD
ncbi:putative ribonuclease H-like domain-containing protein [Tanacetum coccineum]